jgi:hypothetical protein
VSRAFRRALGCLGLLLLLAGTAGFWTWKRLTWKPPAPPPPTPERAAEAREQRERLQKKIARIAPPPPRKTARKEPPPQPAAPRPFLLTLTADELSAALQPGSEAAAYLEGLGLRAPSLELAEDRLTLHATVECGGPELHVTLEATPHITPQGKPRLDLHAIRVGQVAAPATLRRFLESQMDRALKDLDRQIALPLKTIEVHPDRIVIRGRPRPPEDRETGRQEDKETERRS